MAKAYTLGLRIQGSITSLLQETRTYHESLPQEGTATEYEASDDSHTLHHMEGKRKSQPQDIISVWLDGRSTQMEVDTDAGTALSLLMSETTYRKLWKVPPKLKPTTARLSTYSGQRLVVLGTLSVEVKYEAQQVVLSILVV